MHSSDSCFSIVVTHLVTSASLSITHLGICITQVEAAKEDKLHDGVEVNSDDEDDEHAQEDEENPPAAAAAAGTPASGGTGRAAAGGGGRGGASSSAAATAAAAAASRRAAAPTAAGTANDRHGSTATPITPAPPAQHQRRQQTGSQQRQGAMQQHQPGDPSCSLPAGLLHKVVVRGSVIPHQALMRLYKVPALHSTDVGTRAQHLIGSLAAFLMFEALADADIIMESPKADEVNSELRRRAASFFPQLHSPPAQEGQQQPPAAPAHREFSDSEEHVEVVDYMQTCCAMTTDICNWHERRVSDSDQVSQMTHMSVVKLSKSWCAEHACTMTCAGADDYRS